MPTPSLDSSTPSIGSATSVLLSSAMILPSLGTLYRYGGSIGLAVYVAAAALLVPLTVNAYLRRMAKLPARVAWSLSAIGLVTFALLFIVMYPIAQSGRLGPGSDGDDALNLAISELLHGRYPYYPRTYLGNPISPLPGAIFLGMPFHMLLGSAAYQSIFWVVVLFALVVARTGEVRLGLLLLVLLGAMPGFAHMFVVGNDYVPNAIAVIFALQMLLSKHETSPRAAVGSAVLLGLALSFRANFLMLVPLIYSALWQRSGWKPAVRYVLITCGVAAGVTLPFLMYDVQGFSPLHTVGKLQAANGIISHADIGVATLSMLVLVFLAARRSNREDADLFTHCAIQQLVAPLCLCLLSIPTWHETPFSSLQFSAFFSMLAIYACILHCGARRHQADNVLAFGQGNSPPPHAQSMSR